ncbi:helix-turn-helix transcriptional regulator [uncultured Alistipes sp.]|uniref:helix-turn-helix domain-containing protein n=1 Tax=uncultured Alistipes sp. TaxID=538949 RepID=UPI002804651F|nr:helix-turn-helix transcriptional regulator [uncultured Alistipes sp.]
MREKLQELMARENLKPSQLAEKLEINPAGISHIIAGRNKPSFELLQKILRRFPRINPDWLLLDSGPIYRDEIPNSRETPNHAIPGTAPTSIDRSQNPGGTRTEISGSTPDLFNPASSQIEQESVSSKKEQEIGTHDAPWSSMVASGRKPAVQRIVIFYDDQTFETFTPKEQ